MPGRRDRDEFGDALRPARGCGLSEPDPSRTGPGSPTSVSAYSASYIGTMRSAEKVRALATAASRIARWAALVAQQIDGPPAHRLHRPDRLENPVDAVVDHLGQAPRRGWPRPERRRPSPPAPPARTTPSARAAGTDRWPGAGRPPDPAGPGSAHLPRLPAPRASCSASRRSGPSPIMSRVAGIARADPGEDPHHVLDPLHLPEIGDVGDHLVPGGRQRLPLGARARLVLLAGSRSWGSP